MTETQERFEPYLPEEWGRPWLEDFRKTLGIAEPEWLPIPWYGRLRNWLVGRSDAFALWMDDFRYYPKVKPGTVKPLERGTSISWGPVGNLTSATETYRLTPGEEVTFHG